MYRYYSAQTNLIFPTFLKGIKVDLSGCKQVVSVLLRYDENSDIFCSRIGFCSVTQLLNLVWEILNLMKLGRGYLSLARLIRFLTDSSSILKLVICNTVQHSGQQLVSLFKVAR